MLGSCPRDVCLRCPAHACVKDVETWKDAGAFLFGSCACLVARVGVSDSEFTYIHSLLERLHGWLESNCEFRGLPLESTDRKLFGD